MNDDCIFCQIVAGELDSDKVYEDDRLLAFRDANPQAPVHVLVIPKRHISSLKEVTDDDGELLGHLQVTVAEIADDLGLAADGYRVVVNCGSQGGQTVGHLHYHILGGRQMKWPPG